MSYGENVGPFKCKRMRLTIVDDLGESHVLGVVEGATIECKHEGGITPHYDSETGKHAIGTKSATFRVRRFFKTDSDQALLFDLFDNKTHFTLTGEISNLAGSTIGLSDCVIYNYGPVTGGANDIIIEEARGEAADWIKGVTD